MKLDPGIVAASPVSSDVEITPRGAGWFWTSQSVTRGPFSADEFNAEMERIERETLALNISCRIDEDHPDGKLHGACSIKTPSGREWIVGCHRRTPEQLADLDKR